MNYSSRCDSHSIIAISYYIRGTLFEMPSTRSSAAVAHQDPTLTADTPNDSQSSDVVKDQEKTDNKDKDQEVSQKMSDRYNEDDADVTIISSDGMTFKVHSHLLKSTSYVYSPCRKA